MPACYKGRMPYPWPEAGSPEKVEVAARALTVQGDRVLLVYESHLDSWWLPGGRIKPGESLDSAARREAEEETGVPVAIGGCIAVFDALHHDFGRHIFHFVFQATPQQPVAPDERVHVAQDDNPDRQGIELRQRWFTVDEVRALPKVFPDFLRDWPSLLAEAGDGA